MNEIYKKPVVSSILIMLMLGIAACSKIDQNSSVAAAPITVNLSRGQMLSLIAPIAKTGGEKARSKYYTSVLPLGEDFGLKREITLKVTDTIVGDFKPGVFVFYSWPDQEAESQLYTHPDWPSMKALRSAGWDELKIYTDELKEDLTLSFDPEKYYTLAIAWINPKNNTDYYRYMDLIKDALTESDGRFMYKMNAPRFEAHAAPSTAPGQLTLVEWDTKDGLARFQRSSAFKENAKLIGSGVNRFEFYRLSL